MSLSEIFAVFSWDWVTAKVPGFRHSHYHQYPWPPGTYSPECPSAIFAQHYARHQKLYCDALFERNKPFCKASKDGRGVGGEVPGYWNWDGSCDGDGVGARAFPFMSLEPLERDLDLDRRLLKLRETLEDSVKLWILNNLFELTCWKRRRVLCDFSEYKAHIREDVTNSVSIYPAHNLRSVSAILSLD
ncbi:hypothetical protein LENED_007278 [Lentinula edodes]|uniref:Uncharacterized protein n=1 Tax=Lentinula edodes TaxID=5353 RepID=A0A1Q3EE29_LENED|nr:hypothetical protein LENED_007278 [Lentinula edodes]